MHNLVISYIVNNSHYPLTNNILQVTLTRNIISYIVQPHSYNYQVLKNSLSLSGILCGDEFSPVTS